MTATKICTLCQIEKPVGEFSPRKQARDGFHSWCVSCFKEKQVQYRAKYLSDPEKRARNTRASLARARTDPEGTRQRSHETFLRLKRQMLAAYGPSCKCCGEAREPFLTLEHVNRDGAAHRLRVGGGTNTYRDLRRRGWPQEGYTVLCMNCNWATRFGKPCPHQSGPV